MKNHYGFTLIELVIVVIILGILAVIALPKFIDLSSDARTSTTTGIAGALSAANSVNYAARKANSTKGIPITNCTNMSSALQSTLPAGYTITSAAVTVDSVTICTLTGPNSTTATFHATGVN